MELGAANYYLVACSALAEIPRPFANQNATFKTHSRDIFFQKKHYVTCLFDREFEQLAHMGAPKVILQPITI